MARKLTCQKVKDAFDNAMGVYWDDDKMTDLVEQLKEQFPTWTKTIDKIEEDAGTASNERAEGDAEGAYYQQLWWSVTNRINRMFESRRNREAVRSHQTR
jgi:hypothetical protein